MVNLILRRKWSLREGADARLGEPRMFNMSTPELTARTRPRHYRKPLSESGAKVAHVLDP
jgi:hypothetical protein